MKFKKGDEVLITSGKDKGKKGKIEKILFKSKTVLLPGLNIYKRHLKKRDEQHPGGIIKLERPIPVANIALICHKCGKQTRVGFNKKGEKKIRICHKCDSVI